jgi:cytoskeletal protein CcmA (bactofilin family)
MGQMTLPVGRFNEVAVMGELTINGDLDCQDLKVMGQTTVRGGLKGKEGKITGKAVLQNNLEMEELKVMGQLKTEGTAKIDRLRVEGQVSLGGALTAQEIDLRGELKVAGDCTAETFKARGAFAIDGLLNAGEIDIKHYGRCRAREIGGESILVRRGPHSMLARFIKSIFTGLELVNLVTDSVEGDDIYLENTTAKVVRGNRVRIGEGCEIERVEYKDTFEYVTDTHVRASKKI